jgi:hypothetical protein
MNPESEDLRMSNKIALAAASVAATATLTFALAAAGFAPGAPAPVGAVAPATADPTAEPTVQVDTVYVAAPPKQQTITVHKVVKSSGESENEHEAGEND